jgi:hypothetical protein
MAAEDTAVTTEATVEIPEAPPGRRHIPCPVPGYPGYVTVDIVMAPAGFQRWYEKDEKRSARERDHRHPHFRYYECGNHLLEWHVAGVDPARLSAADGSDLPAMELVTFGVFVILDLVRRATERPF